jgi:hypothetical protein
MASALLGNTADRLNKVEIPMAKHRLNPNQRCRVLVAGQLFHARIGDLSGQGFLDVLSAILQQRKAGRKCVAAGMWVQSTPSVFIQIELVEDPVQPLSRLIESDPRVKLASVF